MNINFLKNNKKSYKKHKVLVKKEKTQIKKGWNYRIKINIFFDYRKLNCFYLGFCWVCFFLWDLSPKLREEVFLFQFFLD